MQVCVMPPVLGPWSSFSSTNSCGRGLGNRPFLLSPLPLDTPTSDRCPLLLDDRRRNLAPGAFVSAVGWLWGG